MRNYSFTRLARVFERAFLPCLVLFAFTTSQSMAQSATCPCFTADEINNDTSCHPRSNVSWSVKELPFHEFKLKSFTMFGCTYQSGIQIMGSQTPSEAFCYGERIGLKEGISAIQVFACLGILSEVKSAP